MKHYTFAGLLAVVALTGCKPEATASAAPTEAPASTMAVEGAKSETAPAEASQAAPTAPVAAAASQTLFSCDTPKGKHVELTLVGDSVQYSFGKIGGAPELSLSAHTSEVKYLPWDGFGSSETYTVEIANGNTVYGVYKSIPKGADEIEAGVNVEVNGQYMTTVACKSSTVNDMLEDAPLPHSEG